MSTLSCECPEELTGCVVFEKDINTKCFDVLKAISMLFYAPCGVQDHLLTKQGKQQINQVYYGHLSLEDIRKSLPKRMLLNGTQKTNNGEC